MKPEHGKVITTESYYDGNLSHTKQEFEVSLFTDNNTIIKDISVWKVLSAVVENHVI